MYRATMPNVENPTEKTLAALAINDPLAIEELFTNEAVRFDKQLAAKNPDEISYTLMKNAWLGRKAGVLTLITENWLKSAAPALKPIVGQSLNQLKRHIEESLETFRVAAEKASFSPRASSTSPRRKRPIAPTATPSATAASKSASIASSGFSASAQPLGTTA